MDTILTIRRPRGILILAPLMLATCAAQPVGPTEVATALGLALMLLWVATIVWLAIAVTAAIIRDWRLSRAIRQAESDGVILLARARQARGRAWS